MSHSVLKHSSGDASASKNQLQLYNLRPLTHQNTLLEAEKNQIWIPSVTFTNTATQVTPYIIEAEAGQNNVNAGAQPQGQLFPGDCGKEGASLIISEITFLKINC